jgi:hypothetical protein
MNLCAPVLPVTGMSSPYASVWASLCAFLWLPDVALTTAEIVDRNPRARASGDQASEHNRNQASTGVVEPRAECPGEIDG